MYYPEYYQKNANKIKLMKLLQYYKKLNNEEYNNVLCNEELSNEEKLIEIKRVKKINKLKQDKNKIVEQIAVLTACV